jgi:hypothetical protein
MNPLYKKLLWLAVVFGPIFWLMFTDDGQRRTDTAMLWLFGEDEVHLEWSALDPHFTEQELKQVYTDLEWQCQEQPSAYGDALCATRIGVFNGIPARYITAFFHQRHLSAMKLHYRPRYHAQLLDQLRFQLGRPDEGANGSTAPPLPDGVIRWQTDHGMIVLKHKLNEGDEPAMFWLSPSRIVGYRKAN